MKDVFEKYLLLLRQDRDDKTEHSDRSALETLLNKAAEDAGPGIRIIHEAKKARDFGGPDFKVMKAAMILGYVENKPVSENLDQVLKSEQIARYKKLSNNILLTDYLQFIWIKDGKVNGRELIAFPDDLEGKPKKPREDRVKAVSGLLRGFLSTAPEGIGRAQQLALALATRSHFLRDFLDRELRRQEKEHTEGRLYGLYEIFRAQVFHELTLGEFADAFAQMLAYGLFLAKLNSEGKEITLANARQFVPGSFRLIRELVQFLDDLTAPEYAEIRWVVEEILSIVNGLDLRSIHEDLSFKHRKAISRKVRAQDEEEHRLFERDPFVYFYEDFLGKYDAKMKKARGVYYTPPPIVNFIVRAIDDILKETFGIAQGLADHKRVTVLDFACGTGTFILEVLEGIFENIDGADSPKASLIVRDHMLKNIFGFEYLIAPYTIAHLKLSQYLADKGHALKDGERLQVFLTNTLEPMKPLMTRLLPALSEETAKAHEVKEMKILVVTGNPPYSYQSRNLGSWIQSKIDAYRKCDGRPLGERNPRGLQDDYVKFIRFAQTKMDDVEEGIVGVITNHAWLDNPTFRGMRQSLMSTFHQIFVLDLHGNTKKKERTPSGAGDKNVFDIEQGVSISFLVKKADVHKGVWRADWWGSRLNKYKAGAEQSFANVQWSKIDPSKPQYLFIKQDREALESYNEEWVIGSIFVQSNVGIVTARDDLAIEFEKDVLLKRVTDLSTLSPEAAREKYALGDDTRDWSVKGAINDLKESGPTADYLTSVEYRPFDSRWTYLTGKSRGFLSYPRFEVMQHMQHKNLALITSRLTKGEDFKHIYATDRIIEKILLSSKTSNNAYIFPLYRYPPPEGSRRPKTDLLGGDRIENIAPAFRKWLDEKYEPHFSPEELFGFIYAVLHAPTYRAKYAEFLRIDFPRIPFPENRAGFEALSALGWDLMQKHLLRDIPALKLGSYRGKSTNEVEKPRYAEAERAVYINTTQSFAPVPPEVWDFHIGGYQVIDKYLKSRKGRTLTLDEIQNVENVVKVLAFTIGQMQRIDGAYRVAFEA
ncbi:MAG: N-6 DNA methylase [Pseudomonadota bacterium]|nr:N-6 DNA methylase [Pseudomonadota bacterium]